VELDVLRGDQPIPVINTPHLPESDFIIQQNQIWQLGWMIAICMAKLGY
jgi:hypothetical protein